MIYDKSNVSKDNHDYFITNSSGKIPFSIFTYLQDLCNDYARILKEYILL